jgi:hypothetical protein
MAQLVLGYLGYFAVLMAIFFWVRTYTWTEEQALPAKGRKPGFGPQIGLIEAAKGMFQHGGPRVLAVACVVAIVARVAVFEVSLADVWVVLGLVAFWPFQEWMIHAWLEHLPAFHFGNRKMELVITKTHRAHHRNPWDPKYGLTTTYFVVLFLGGVPMVWSVGYNFGVVPLHATLTGVLVTFLFILNYEWVHYLIHTSYTPRTWFYKRLWKNHRLHHFQNENYWFGLTMLLGDRVLGTQAIQGEAARSKTVLNLGVESTADDINETVPST